MGLFRRDLTHEIEFARLASAVCCGVGRAGRDCSDREAAKLWSGSDLQSYSTLVDTSDVWRVVCTFDRRVLLEIQPDRTEGDDHPMMRRAKSKQSMSRGRCIGSMKVPIEQDRLWMNEENQHPIYFGMRRGLGPELCHKTDSKAESQPATRSSCALDTVPMERTSDLQEILHAGSRSMVGRAPSFSMQTTSSVSLRKSKGQNIFFVLGEY